MTAEVRNELEAYVFATFVRYELSGPKTFKSCHPASPMRTPTWGDEGPDAYLGYRGTKERASLEPSFRGGELKHEVNPAIIRLEREPNTKGFRVTHVERCEGAAPELRLVTHIVGRNGGYSASFVPLEPLARPEGAVAEPAHRTGDARIRLPHSPHLLERNVELLGRRMTQTRAHGPVILSDRTGDVFITKTADFKGHVLVRNELEAWDYAELLLELSLPDLPCRTARKVKLRVDTGPERHSVTPSPSEKKLQLRLDPRLIRVERSKDGAFVVENFARCERKDARTVELLRMQIGTDGAVDIGTSKVIEKVTDSKTHLRKPGAGVRY